jgi:hypothetical protein
VQGKVYERELTGDPEALIERGRAVRLRGVVGAEKFLSYLEHVQALAGATADGVLVAMNPVPGLSPALAMGQLQLRRFGDVACELGGLVYLYLFGCHPHLVEVALGNVFALPYQEIFADHAAYVSTRQIADEHESMKRVFEAQRQDPQGVADAPGSERPWPAAGNVAAMAAGPQAPRLMALPLRK